MNTTPLVSAMVEENLTLAQTVVMYSKLCGYMFEFREQSGYTLPTAEQIYKSESIDYYKEQLEEANAEFKRLSGLTLEQQFDAGKAVMVAANQVESEIPAYIAKCEAMIKELKDWDCGEEYQDFKNQILTTLIKELKHIEEVGVRQEDRKTEAPPTEVYRQLLDSARREIPYYTKQIQEAEERVLTKTRWIEGLRTALGM